MDCITHLTTCQKHNSSKIEVLWVSNQIHQAHFLELSSFIALTSYENQAFLCMQVQSLHLWPQINPSKFAARILCLYIDTLKVQILPMALYTFIMWKYINHVSAINIVYTSVVTRVYLYIAPANMWVLFCPRCSIDVVCITYGPNVEIILKCWSLCLIFYSRLAMYVVVFWWFEL